MTTADETLGEFSVTVDFEGPIAVLSVRGYVGSLQALELGALLDAVIGRGHRSVVVNLASVDVIDAMGLRVIADSADRLG